MEYVGPNTVVFIGFCRVTRYVISSIGSIDIVLHLTVLLLSYFKVTPVPIFKYYASAEFIWEASDCLTWL